VKEEYRKKGIAKELIKICLKNLKKQGIKKVFGSSCIQLS